MASHNGNPDLEQTRDVEASINTKIIPEGSDVSIASIKP